MAYTRPGVYVTETPLRAAPPRPNSDAVAAFFGTSDRGPTVPTLVNSWAGYRSAFGDLSQNHDLGYAVYHYFANGGRVAYVTRVSGAGATAASTAAVSYYPTQTAASLGNDENLMTLTAKNVGVWGNSVTVTISSGQIAPTSSVLPTFNLQVKLNGAEVEYWAELSADPNSNRYFDAVLNEYSSYLVSSLPATVTADSGFEYVESTYALGGGSDGSAISGSDYASALATLADVDGSLIINLVGRYGTTEINQALTTAGTRGNSFVIIDPDPSATDASSIQISGSSYTSDYAGYGAVYYPMVKMVDPMKTGPAAVRVTYPGGAIAGAYVRNDAQRTVAKTPAGYDVDLRNTLGLVTNMTDAIVSAVYNEGVNCLKAVPGAGVVILGGRTLKKGAPDKYISVRRSLNYVKQNLVDLTRGAVFQPNSPQLWSAITSSINKFLTTFWGQGGLKGQSSLDAFYVVCDETNNTAETIDNGEVHIEVGVALQYPAEFIVINVSQWTGGSNTAENL